MSHPEYPPTPKEVEKLNKSESGGESPKAAVEARRPDEESEEKRQARQKAKLKECQARTEFEQWRHAPGTGLFKPFEVLEELSKKFLHREGYEKNKKLAARETVNIGGKECRPGDIVYLTWKDKIARPYKILGWDWTGVYIRYDRHEQLSLRERMGGVGDIHCWEWERLDKLSPECPLLQEQEKKDVK